MSKVSVGRAALDSRPHFLYRFYDRTGALLYIGITVDFEEREKQHAKSKDWWERVDRNATRVEYHLGRRAALDAERLAIKAEQPLENDQHNEWVEVNDEDLAQTASDFASAILVRMLGGAEVANQAVREIGADITSSAERNIQVALSVADTIQDAMSAYEQLIGMLVTWLPSEVVDMSYKAAAAPLNLNPHTQDLHLHAAAVTYIDGVMSQQLLDSLEQAEADHWRDVAERLLKSRQQRGGSAIPTGMITTYAAAYARASRSEASHRFAAIRCAHVDDECPKPAVQYLVFNDCSRCFAVKGECRGHGPFCEQHLMSHLGIGQPKPQPLGAV